MKYLFFDIECSNCFNGIGKMCEFGYVLTDESLHVMKSGEIPMSPGKGRAAKFHLTGRKHEKDLILAYENDYYFEQPEFPHFYKKIKEMVEDPDTVCFAYSMDNDIPHLYNACKRYRLEPFKYECCDVQKIVAAYFKKKDQVSLRKACLKIVGPNAILKLQEHLSRDDAEMERLVFEGICTLSKTSPAELLEQSEFARTNSVKYMKRIEDKHKRKRFKEAGQNLYKSMAAADEELDKSENIGRRYSVSGELKANLNALKETINLIQRQNGILCRTLDKSDYFITYNDEDKEKILNGLKRPFNGKILTYIEFAKIDI